MDINEACRGASSRERSFVMANNFFTDNEDLLFQFEQIDWKSLVELAEKPYPREESYGSPEEAKEFFRDMLTSMGEFVAEQIAPHAKELDAQHPEFVGDGEVKDPPRMAAIMKQLGELGAMSLAQPRRCGGMNTPILVGNILMEMMARADVSTMSHYGFHAGIAQALTMYSMEEGSFEMEDGQVVKSRFDEQIAKMASGEEWGAMVLTEPGAGSDLAQIRAKAELQDDGSWRLTGQKIYITSGHGEHHIVIARSEPVETHPGLKGLSLFYVPAHVEKDGKRVRNFEIGGIEHKMGQHSAVAATLNYEDSYAELIGKRGHGFLGMLLLMNNARIAVGFEALGIMENAYRQAVAYAEERVTMGKPIGKHEMIADYLDEMELVIAGLRAITFEAAFQEESSSRLKGILKTHPPGDEEERRRREKEMRRYKRRARHLTPLIKYVGGEECVRFSRMAMQIYGGLGYIVETGGEKLLRDALVIPVYEGTSQIQALMALKDNLGGVMRNPGKFFSDMATTKLDVVRARDPMDRLAAKLRAHQHSALQTIITNIAADKLGDLKGKPVLEWKAAFTQNWDPNKDFSFGLLHAERLTKILSWNAMAERLVAQAHEAEGSDYEDERREIAIAFLERFEPKARGVLGEIEAQGGLLKRVVARMRKVEGPKEKPEDKAA